MRVTVVRTGGFAGLRLTWSVRVDDQPDPAAWVALVDAVPWDAVPEPAGVPGSAGPGESGSAGSVGSGPAGAPDRYVYRISCEPHEAVVGESALDGPWRALVERVREAAARDRETGRAAEADPLP